MSGTSRRPKGVGAAGGHKDRRRQYRTSDDIEHIRVSMALPEHVPIQGTLIDLSATGAAVLMRRTSTEDKAAFAVGVDIHLTFEVSGIDPIPDVSAIVRNARDTDDGRIFGVEIVDSETLHAELPARVFAAFNRRRHYRLEFTEESSPAVEVQALPDGPSVAARLGNVSVSGCMLVFATGQSPELQSPLRIQFELPGTDHRFSFHGVVRSAFELKGSARCGVEFDARRSESFMAQEQRLSQFIVKRQQELRALK